LRVLYVSSMAPYKHQLEVIAAVNRLSAELPIELTLVGPPDGTRYVDGVERAVVPDGNVGNQIRYRGAMSFDELHHAYEAAEVFVFASSCENMPIILLEAMSSGLPIACARRGPMPAMLGDAGVYFDPERPEEIAEALRTLAYDPALRTRIAEAAGARSQTYTWDRCARDTFAFLADVAAAAAA
jgi:glycosyltransferase involved in cell wall biosynthesis